jgi:hypothetical protein
METYEIDMSEFAGAKGYIRDYFQMERIKEIVIPWVSQVGPLVLDFTDVVYVGKRYRWRFEVLADMYDVEIVNAPWKRFSPF